MASDLAARLTRVVAAAFEAAGLDPALGRVQRAQRPELADFQCNGAMAAAKAAKRNPREIAADIAARLGGQAPIAGLEVAGPGFLNIRVAPDALSARASEALNTEMSGAAPATDAEKLIIDFGGANVAKPMHVGHLRSAVIGDTLQRLCRFLGDEVTSDVHLGDWGLQMGHLITELQDEQPELPYFAIDETGPFPADPPVTIEDLGRLYPQASAKAKADPERNARSQEAVAEMQAGRAGYLALLRHFINVSIAALKVDYAALNVSFDLWKGEADVDPLIPGLVDDLKSRGIAELDDGAWIIRVERAGDKKDIPPFMLVNSKGASGYHATDLATIKDRVDTLAPQRMLYVVDQRQALHFEQVFRAADIAGLFPEAKLEHIGFGTVNGTDGKPFKTREGGALRLADLNQMALDEARKKLSETELSADLSEADRAEIARKVALAALRFADLQNMRTTNYVFDLERFTSFEGKTGPYLLYAAVRIKSLLRRAAAEGREAGEIRIESDAERQLALALDGFGPALIQAREKRYPHYICEHVYGLAQAFSAFYAAHPIAAEPDAWKRASRLALSEAVLRQLETGLDLLGIETPERM